MNFFGEGRLMKLKVFFIILCANLWATEITHTSQITPLTETTKKKYELSIAAMFQNEARHFKEWIEFHRIVGVDHFYLYNNHSTDNWQEVLDPYIKKGIVEVIDWSTPETKNSSYYAHCATQIIIFRDVLKRAENVTEWLALMDSDEFIFPMKECATIPECLNKFFADADGIYVNWRHFGTNNVTLGPNDSMIANLTACSNENHSENKIGKSIVRPHQVRINNVECAHHFVLKDGQRYYNADHEKINTDDKKLNTHYEELYTKDKNINADYTKLYIYFKNIHNADYKELYINCKNINAICCKNIFDNLGKPDPIYYYNRLCSNCKNIDAIRERLNWAHNYLKRDFKYHDSYIRMNHYRMGDEKYFQDVRLPRQKKFGQPTEEQLWKDYNEFNQEKDEKIIDFMKEYHPLEYVALLKGL